MYYTEPVINFRVYSPVAGDFLDLVQGVAIKEASPEVPSNPLNLNSNSCPGYQSKAQWNSPREVQISVQGSTLSNDLKDDKTYYLYRFFPLIASLASPSNF